MKKKALSLIIVIFICIISLTACNAADRFFVFGTDLNLKITGTGGSKVLNTIAGYIDSLEPILSPTIENSDIYNINNSAVGEPVVCHDETMQIMRTAELVYNESGGAYDPSVYPLVRLWKFAGDLFSYKDQAPPSDEDIAATLKVVGLDNFRIDYDASTITKLKEGAMLDFGGVAKGYAADTARKFAGNRDKLLVNLGGNIAGSGKSYFIGIENPRPSNTQYFGTVTIGNGYCISTSGDYERYYTYNGVRYHHILDPSSGRPTESENGLISVSIISKDGALGDAVATAVMVLGKDSGAALVAKLGLTAIIISSDMSVEVVGSCDFKKV